METCAIVLAAGAGTRMKSEKPKVAHEVLGKPMVCWVIDAARKASANRIISVVGHGREQVIPLVQESSEVVVQKEQKGTAHAVLTCKHALENFEGSVVVLSGDSPLISAHTIRSLISVREEKNAAVVVLTMNLEDPYGYGRIIRDSKGAVERIVEQKDTSEEEAAIRECNSGVYCFDARALFDALEQVNTNNAQGEFYLTDVLYLSRAAGREVLALPTEDATECLGVNSRVQLAQAVCVAQKRINISHMQAGVTMWSPETTWIGPDVELCSDVELLPGVMLLGKTRVLAPLSIGPNVCVRDESLSCVHASMT